MMPTGIMSLLILLFNSVMDIIINTVVVLVKEQQYIMAMKNGIIL